MRAFVVIGRNATDSGRFSLEDLPSSSGRLDVLLRCTRAALLISHGVRRNARVYLVLGGGSGGSGVLRFDGADARFLRPDERSLALLVQKALRSREGPTRPNEFAPIRAGLHFSGGGLSAVLGELRSATKYLLEEGAPDVRDTLPDPAADAAFFVGDHSGFDDDARTAIVRAGATCVSIGPVSVHSEDVISVLWNELDRVTHRAAIS